MEESSCFRERKLANGPSYIQNIFFCEVHFNSILHLGPVSIMGSLHCVFRPKLCIKLVIPTNREVYVDRQYSLFCCHNCPVKVVLRLNNQT